jgi:hypothetical protein
MATFSEDKQYRYRLWRHWDLTKPCVLFIMMNPSTANENRDDRTIRIIKKHATAWGFGGMFIGNLYARCCSNSTNARKIINPNERDYANEDNIREMVKMCEKVVYAWGTKGPLLKSQRVPGWLHEIVGESAYCMETTKKEKIPKHPGQRVPNIMEVKEAPTQYAENLCSR